MKNSLIILGLVLVSFAGRAQNNAETFFNAQIGLGITAPYYSVDEIADNGLFLQGEYGIRLRSWVQFRPYIGFISTHSNGTDMMTIPLPKGLPPKLFYWVQKEEYGHPFLGSPLIWKQV